MRDAVDSQFRAGRAEAGREIRVRTNHKRFPGAVRRGFGRLFQGNREASLTSSASGGKTLVTTTRKAGIHRRDAETRRREKKK
jgi:hypothetical protein